MVSSQVVSDCGAYEPKMTLFSAADAVDTLLCM